MASEEHATTDEWAHFALEGEKKMQGKLTAKTKKKPKKTLIGSKKGKKGKKGKTVKSPQMTGSIKVVEVTTEVIAQPKKGAVADEADNWMHLAREHDTKQEFKVTHASKKKKPKKTLKGSKKGRKPGTKKESGKGHHSRRRRRRRRKKHRRHTRRSRRRRRRRRSRRSHN